MHVVKNMQVFKLALPSSVPLEAVPQFYRLPHEICITPEPLKSISCQYTWVFVLRPQESHHFKGNVKWKARYQVRALVLSI